MTEIYSGIHALFVELKMFHSQGQKISKLQKVAFVHWNFSYITPISPFFWHFYRICTIYIEILLLVSKFDFGGWGGGYNDWWWCQRTTWWWHCYSRCICPWKFSFFSPLESSWHFTITRFTFPRFSALWGKTETMFAILCKLFWHLYLFWPLEYWHS